MTLWGESCRATRVAENGWKTKLSCHENSMPRLFVEIRNQLPQGNDVLSVSFDAQLGYVHDGGYPERLEDAGVTVGDRGGRWSTGYVSSEYHHSLVYPATFIIFEAWLYDFEEGRWVYLYD